MDRINLQQKFSLFTEQWDPRIIAQVNEYQVKIARIEGDFPMHRHEETDELFLVVQGTIRMDFEDRQVPLGEGDLIVVPRGVLHRPHADSEARIMMFEPAGTLNTGDVRDEHTKEKLERI
ncbi:cupin domain-containing protein [Marispirochaeta aestuarii]|uniref:cupin domain-containing protein n=1 Tax=Marispirochaeta aestuarii TaxID=1963862 RepID=UPI0029C772CF|nr:cupin domain-containing protein [Marispirochaeta aestuarii]